jgi:hypothetical protein
MTLADIAFKLAQNPGLVERLKDGTAACDETKSLSPADKLALINFLAHGYPVASLVDPNEDPVIDSTNWWFP